MNWLDRCERGRFRGFEFLTDSHEARGGRRLVVHEYPGRDEPLVEDLGGKAGGWRINAYFIGPNYDLERNGFLRLLAQPGADWMTHPWLGYIWVRVADWSLRESNDQGGMCTVSIDLVPGGEQPFQVEPDRVDVAFSQIAQFKQACLLDFDLEAMSAGGLTSFIAAVHAKLEAVRNVLSLATLPVTWAAQAVQLVTGIKTDLAALLGVPGAYANALLSFFNLLGAGPAGADIVDTNRARVVRRIVSAASAISPAAVTTDAAVRRNLTRDDAVSGRLMIAAAAEIAVADYRAAEDRDAALAAVVDAVDAALPTMSDPVFQAAVSMRVAVIEALMAQDLDPAQQRDVVTALPAVVLAYRMDVDEDVLIARNRVRHPLFVQGRVYG